MNSRKYFLDPGRAFAIETQTITWRIAEAVGYFQVSHIFPFLFFVLLNAITLLLRCRYYSPPVRPSLLCCSVHARTKGTAAARPSTGGPASHEDGRVRRVVEGGEPR